MKVGVSQIDFTPRAGFMPGQFEAQFATGSHMPMCANAIAFEEDGVEILLISADYMAFPTHYADKIRAGISQAIGLPTERILLAATHTHTGPGWPDECWRCPADPLVSNIIAKRIVAAGIAAHNDLSGEAGVASGITEDRRFCFCRDWVLKDGRIVTNPGYNRTDLDHTCMEPDYRVNVMRVERDGRLAAILVNYANHPDTTFLHMRTKYHPDYPGVLRVALQEKYGEDVKVIFLNGACGDINDRDFGNKTDINGGHRDPAVIPPEVIGRGIADTVSRLLDTLTVTAAGGTVSGVSRRVTVNRRQITEEERAWAHSILRAAEDEYQSNSQAETARKYLETCDNVPQTETFEIALMQIGDVAIVGLPGEIYTRVGKAIKDGSPFSNTMISTLTNGYHGYVIPDHVRNNGSYEGRFSSGSTGYGAEKVIVCGAVEMLKEL